MVGEGRLMVTVLLKVGLDSITDNPHHVFSILVMLERELDQKSTG